MFPGSQQLDGAAQAAAQMPLSMPEGEAMFNTNSISSKSAEQAGFQQLSKKVHIAASNPVPPSFHLAPQGAFQIGALGATSSLAMQRGPCSCPVHGLCMQGSGAHAACSLGLNL